MTKAPSQAIDELGNHERYNTVGHEHLSSQGPHQGEPAYLMVVECADGRFYLEDEFDDWKEVTEVAPRHKHSVDPVFYPTQEKALQAACKLICERFKTDAALWMEAAANPSSE